MRFYRGLIVSLALGALVMASGCPAREKKGPDKKENDKGQTAAGWLFATAGDEFHLRLKIDATTKQASAALFDETTTEPVPIKADKITVAIKNGEVQQIDLAAKGATKGRTATFEGKHDRFGEKVDPKKVEVNAQIEGKPYLFTLDVHH
jgi:hypothetical protein